MILSPLTAVVVSILLTLPLALGDNGFGILYLFTVGPFLLLVAAVVWLMLAATTSGGRRFCHAAALLLLFPVPVLAMKAPATVLIATHDAVDLVSWHYSGGEHRAPERMTTTAGLPHAIWRQWGFLSVWTEAYLVFDEADALASSAFQGGDVPGVPCGVWHVLPLQKQWYVVTLYSGQTWDQCS